jgi:hypothetical protein
MDERGFEEKTMSRNALTRKKREMATGWILLFALTTSWLGLGALVYLLLKGFDMLLGD